jgi:hypothetical protein
MNKKRILLVLRVLTIIVIVVAAGFAFYFWNRQMPMKAVLCAMGGAMIVFNFIVTMFLVNRNMRK